MKGMGPDEDYVILGETPISELKMTGFASDNGQYLNLGMRTLMFLDENKEYLSKWDWITFVDDDAYVFRGRLRNKLKKEDSKDMSIVMGKTPGEIVITMNNTPVRFTLMHGGATISLNKLAVHHMLNYLDKNRSWLFDRSKLSHSFFSFGDVCVSFLCRKSRAKIINCPFHMSFIHHKFNRLNHSDYYKIITSHNMTDEDKQKLYEVDIS